MNAAPTHTFRAQAARALQDRALRDSMQHATSLFVEKRADGVSGLPIEEWRDRASEIRTYVLDHLWELLEQFTANATAAGAVVHYAADGDEARRTVAGILRDHGARRVVKAKSMVTEEIHLNAHLEQDGVQVVETDLGEYIVQIADETPSHILAPAIHKNRRQIGALFAEKLGFPYSENPRELTQMARSVLREEFLHADAGISGANLAPADTGSIVLFTNEGNGRMVTTLPKLHIAVLSLEKVIPHFSDLPVFIRLLPRSATGQILSSYVSVVTGVRKTGEATGAEHMHLVLVDNGRSEILKSGFREILKCIRCSACMNVCPVYRIIGGHAYGSTYPGPMGIVLSNLLDGMAVHHELLDASTLCGACVEVCPVRVPLTELIAGLRERKVDYGMADTRERLGMASFGLAAQSPRLFGLGQRLGRAFWPLLQRLDREQVLQRLPAPVARTFGRRNP